MQFPRAPRCLVPPALVATATLFAAVAACAQAAPEAKALRLRSLAATCAQCHGTDGRAVADSLVPPLAGMPASRFRERMAAFRSATANDPNASVMPQLARGFSDAQIDQLAAWFSVQPR